MALNAIRKKDFETAKGNFEAGLSVNKKHGVSLNNLGILEALSKKVEKAQTYFEQALIDFPGYKDAEYNLNQLAKGRTDFRWTERELRPNLLRYTE